MVILVRRLTEVEERKEHAGDDGSVLEKLAWEEGSWCQSFASLPQRKRQQTCNTND